MPVPKEDLIACIQKQLPHADITVTPLRYGDDHYQVSVVDDSFKGLPLIQQHRLVYQALGDLLKDKLHAMSLTTNPPQN